MTRRRGFVRKAFWSTGAVEQLHPAFLNRSLQLSSFQATFTFFNAYLHIRLFHIHYQLIQTAHGSRLYSVPVWSPDYGVPETLAY